MKVQIQIQMQAVSRMLGVVAVCLALGTATLVQAAGVEMTLWINSWPQAGINAIQEVADRFAERHPDVNSVTVQAVSQAQLLERLAVAVAGGSPPDVMALPAPLAQPALGGLLMPLNRFIDQSAVIDRADYPPFMLESLSFEGREYGVPAIEAALGLLLVYNRDLLLEAGLADRGPDSLDELYEMHLKLTRMDETGERLEQVGINPLDSMGGQYFPLIWGTVFDVSWYDLSRRKLDLIAIEPALEYLKRIYDAPGYDLITGAGIGGWTGGLASGRLAMQVNGSWVPGELTTFPDAGKFGYTWMPSLPGDKATSSSPWGLTIPVNAPRPDLSFELIEFFATPEALQIVFDAVGWLNGNLSSIRELDVSAAPEIVPIIGMFNEADRFTAPPPLPILTDIYNVMSGRVTPFLRGEADGRSILLTLQDEMQARLDEVFRAAGR